MKRPSSPAKDTHVQLTDVPTTPAALAAPTVRLPIIKGDLRSTAPLLTYGWQMVLRRLHGARSSAT